ncbi:hypothetical protein BDN71DRAFT_1351172, partial [Pleurotus eryngii]
LGTAHRPPQIGHWIKSARPYTRKPKIKDIDAYVSKWWKWWKGINPGWRRQSGSERLTKEGSGSWDTLHVTGANGNLSVLVSLWFWREHMPDTSPTLRSWNEAVEDVNWALHQL